MRKAVLSGVLCASIAATATHVSYEALEQEPVAAATLENTNYLDSPFSSTLALSSLLPKDPIEQSLDNEPNRIPEINTDEPGTTLKQALRKEFIYILGDSIMQGAQADVEAALTLNGWADVIIKASCGRPLIGNGVYESCDAGRPASLTGLAQIAEDQELIAKADKVVIALGTNDHGSNAKLFGDYVKQAIDRIKAINPDVTVHWVNTYLATSENYQAINEAIVESGVDVIDFAAQAPAYYSQSECPDGIHPCKSGYGSIARLILAHIESK